MDLKQELLSVLNNPTRIWESIVQNLSSEPRICLLTLATTTPPINLVEWQSAVARVSTETAVMFEAAIRVLDDSFVEIRRDQFGRTMVQFRNPSVEEFCATLLNKNAGFATNVATQNPSLDQIRRLIQLGTAGSPQQRTYSSVYAALIEDPSVLVSRLLTILGQQGGPGKYLTEAVLLLVQLVGQGRLDHLSSASEIKDLLTRLLLKCSFDTNGPLLFKLLDDGSHARTVASILGDRLGEFYDGLVASAASLSHFDSLMNFDRALGRSPLDASWAEKFESLNDVWLEEGGDGEELQANRDYYGRIAEYLDLDDLSGLSAWEQAVEEAGDEEHEPDDDSWRESETYNRAKQNYRTLGGRVGSERLSEQQAETSRIDALFGGLAESKARE